MKKSTFLVVFLVVGGTFLVVWRLRGNSDAAVAQQGSSRTGESFPAVGQAAADATEADKLLAQGLAALGRGDQAAAKEIFAGLVKRFPAKPAGARAAVKLAEVYRNEGDLYAARNALSTGLEGIAEGLERESVIKNLHILNGELVFSKKEAPDSLTYVAKSGDNLTKIGLHYRITAGFIKRINYLTSDMIQIGQSLKVFQGPFDIVIEKSKFRLGVYRSGIFIREYRIGLGKNGSTPEGEFAVTEKLVDPEWNLPGVGRAASGAPDNPLGTRWIGFAPHYGIHGTIEPETIGGEDSRGCVRLLNEEVEELYDLVVAGSKVTIRP